MLFEFHKKQNAKKPKSVHATYLLTGKKHTSEHTNGINGKDGDDMVMRSSPFMSSMPEPEEPEEAPISKTSIVLVREEELESMWKSVMYMRDKTADRTRQRPSRDLKRLRQYTYTAWSQVRSRYDGARWNLAIES
jgi:hypothetical protein